MAKSTRSSTLLVAAWPHRNAAQNKRNFFLGFCDVYFLFYNARVVKLWIITVATNFLLCHNKVIVPLWLNVRVYIVDKTELSLQEIASTSNSRFDISVGIQCNQWVPHTNNKYVWIVHFTVEGFTGTELNLFCTLPVFLYLNTTSTNDTMH